MNEHNTQPDMTLTLFDLTQLPLIRERERAEATVNFKRLLESGTGVALNLGLQPTLLLNGRNRRGITAFKAVYRRGDTVRFREFNGHTHISDSDEDWKILLIPDANYPELYLATEGHLVFFPEEHLMEETDFLEVFYRTANYNGILRVVCYDGVPSVFTEINTNQYGVLYGELVDELASLVVDINALQSLNEISQLNSAPENDPMEVFEEW